MRLVLQRVTRASVSVDNEVVGEIDAGLLILVGVADGDTETQAEALARKVAGLRIFADADDRFNESLLDIAGPPWSSVSSPCTPTCAKGVVPASPAPLDPRSRSRSATTSLMRCESKESLSKRASSEQ